MISWSNSIFFTLNIIGGFYHTWNNFKSHWSSKTLPKAPLLNKFTKETSNPQRRHRTALKITISLTLMASVILRLQIICTQGQLSLSSWCISLILKSYYEAMTLFFSTGERKTNKGESRYRICSCHSSLNYIGVIPTFCFPSQFSLKWKLYIHGDCLLIQMFGNLLRLCFLILWISSEHTRYHFWWINFQMNIFLSTGIFLTI